MCIRDRQLTAEPIISSPTWRVSVSQMIDGSTQTPCSPPAQESAFGITPANTPGTPSIGEAATSNFNSDNKT
eukprot:10764892-Prorocentrum_lima.AAC.1